HGGEHLWSQRLGRLRQEDGLSMGPVGALLLERCRVIREEPGAFSISFIEDPERKYHFECSSEEQCQEWMEALRRASYEFMRRSLVFYRNEIRKVTGKVCAGLQRVAGVGLQVAEAVLRPWLMATRPPHRTPWSSSAYPRRPGSS
uniref:Pleckstrin homology domain-containing family J member 1 n=1 Tax=Mandrillus leucophaeus TaxID=9568 RepID=A0A2K5XR58_MANLE